MVRKVQEKLLATEDSSSPQPDVKYIIQALMEENKALTDSKVYLVALLRQVQEEFNEAQQIWEAERASLSKSKEE